MKQALGLALAVISLTLAPGTVLAQAIARYPADPQPSPFPDRNYSRHGSVAPYSPLPYAPPAFIVGPTWRQAWVPPFWHWNGYAWVWVPGHWVWY